MATTVPSTIDCSKGIKKDGADYDGKLEEYTVLVEHAFTEYTEQKSQ